MADFAKINPKKCNLCGICVAVCPSRCLVMKKNSVFQDGNGCIECGHCDAVCEQQAITLASSRSSSFQYRSFSFHPQWLPHGQGNVGEIVRLMHSRRSCRRYATREVPHSLLVDLIHIGTSAPSGTNSQAWSFRILENRSQVQEFGQAVADFYRRLNKTAKNSVFRLLDRLVGSGRLSWYYERYYPVVADSLRAWQERQEDRLFHGAPAAIAVGVDNSASCAAEDAMLATQNMLLAAHVMGLGTCLIGYAVEGIRREIRLQKMLKINGAETVYAVIALGYPAVRYRSLIGRKEPVVHFPLR